MNKIGFYLIKGFKMGANNGNVVIIETKSIDGIS